MSEYSVAHQITIQSVKTAVDFNFKDVFNKQPPKRNFKNG